ncbi:MAG TPA: hypothetical protein VMW52_09235, partial [Phycisphaerae bacterium]|nr:hypothetical protein [Phycisphaerae bacterium]
MPETCCFIPQTRRDLYDAIGLCFGVWLPWKCFTHGHSSPLDFVWDAYSHPADDLAAWANRSGGKTLCASIIAALEFAVADKPLKARVLSGSEDQARNLYAYWAQWAVSVLADRLVGAPNKGTTRIGGGEFEILAASQKRVRGGKVQRLFRDEVDEIDPELIGASVGMLDSRDGLPARIIDTSTWHHVGGPMATLVEGAAAAGVRLHKWGVWESLEQCPADRHDGGRGCRSCELAAVCLAKRQEHGQGNPNIGLAADCCGILSIDDAIRQRRRWSQEQWEAEAECRRPSPEGLVYPQFDRAAHVRDVAYDPDLPLYLAIDWGLNNFVCLDVQETKRGEVRVVDEYHSQHVILADAARDILRRNRLDDGRKIVPTAVYCDPAGRAKSDQTGRSDIQTFEALTGYRCTYSMAA